MWPSSLYRLAAESPFTQGGRAVKILVAIKRVADPENLNKIKVTAQGKIDAAGLEPKPSPYDEYALEAALRLTENGANTKQRLGEVVVVTFGPKEAEQTLRAMLGTGADRAIRVDATDDALDGDLVARGLKTIADKEKPDLVLLGYQQAEDESNEVGQMLAEYLGWPQATFAGSIESEDDKALVVGREVDGATAQVRVKLPAVVTVLDKIVYPKGVRSKHTAPTHAYPDGVRFAALMAIMAAKKKQLAEMKLVDLVPDAAPKVRYGSVELPPKRAAGVKVKDVKELVTRLKTEAKVV
jgi:electron transfer flavoprotein beta subunit